MKKLLNFFLVLSCLHSNAQNAAQQIYGVQPEWSAYWISMAGVSLREYGVFHFRKTFQIDTIPLSFVVHVSADNRYRLFVNGSPVCNGPARGDLYNWYYETVDLAPFLKKGKNLIAAMVWNMGEMAPVAQISNRTAFVLQGNTEKEKLVNTGKDWKVFSNKAYRPCSTDNSLRLQTYMVIGPGDEVNAASYPWGWEKNQFNDAAWPAAINVTHAVAYGHGSDNLWTLVPRNIPLMQENLQHFPIIRKMSGMALNSNFLSGKSVVIPAHSMVSILIDQTYNTVAYPELIVSKGKDALIQQTYAESLFTKDRLKGNRNEIEGKKIFGNYDLFRPDGGEFRNFRPLWQRGFRYIQLDITTRNQPLILNDFYSRATGYPLEEKASFTSNDTSLQEIWKVGWHTALLCAGETYYDCPYYEQLQYEGDTRIQSLISLYVSGDDRLMRKALMDFNHSRVSEGLTQGRYPSNRLQVIPPFSLFWVSMVYDYFMHRKDEKFVESFLIPVRGVLNWYEHHLDPDKHMLGPMPWWNFVDWNLSFPNGVADGANDGHSSIISLQYSYTLQQAAEMFDHFGNHMEASHYRKLAQELNEGTFLQCFDSLKKEMANTPQKTSFSQHAGIMGVLAGCITDDLKLPVMNHVLYDTALSQATFYYRFYLTRALTKSGMANLYYSQLSPWRNMLKLGLTTFAESPDPTRSDCHAWSSSPNYDFLATICGITPDKPGFSSVRIEPALGELNFVQGKMPHPDGIISVLITKKGDHGVEAEISLPASLTGTFIWQGRKMALKGGMQIINL